MFMSSFPNYSAHAGKCLFVRIQKCRLTETSFHYRTRFTRTAVAPEAAENSRPTIHDDSAHKHEKRHDKINLEEVTQRVIGWRRKEEYNYDKSNEAEEDREMRLNSHLYRRLFPWKSKEELAGFLCNHVVHHSDGVVAINKPFGVGVRNVFQAKEDNIELLKRSGKEVPILSPDSNPLHHIRGTGACAYTLEDVMPLLRTKLQEPNLQLQKSVEKFNSGIAVFGTSEKVAERIRKSLKMNKPRCVKTFSFYIVSTNISHKFLNSGTLTEQVAITLAEHPETKVAHPIILREFSRKKARDVTSNINPVSLDLTLLATNRKLNVCLSQIDTNSVSNNFLRVYYANIVAPILGDHLYHSRVGKVGGVMVAVPPAMTRIGVGHQALAKEVISSLRLRTAQDSLVIPLHAHLNTLTLSNFQRNGKHLYLTAPPHTTFSWTCKKLSLELPALFGNGEDTA